MQYTNEKSLQLRKALGDLIKNKREEQKLSGLKFANSYDINDSNLGKIERAETDCKLVTLWEIAEALGIPLSELILALENKLGKDFKLIDE